MMFLRKPYVTLFINVPFANKDIFKNKYKARWSNENKQWSIVYDYESCGITKEDVEPIHKKICELIDFLKTINGSINGVKDELDTLKWFGTYKMIFGIETKCVKCGTENKDPAYHWCFKCFSEWNDRRYADKCLIIDDEEGDPDTPDKN